MEDSNGTPIEVRVESISRLFDTLDPFPYPQRDLDRSVEEFIVGWARELPKGQPLTIVVHLPMAATQTKDALGLPLAVDRYFTYRADAVSRELKELFRIGRRALAVGLTVLTLCLFLSQFLSNYLNQSTIGQIVAESLIIAGWVANWKPIEIFLYDWWPLARRRSLYRRLAAAKVELRPF